MVINHFNPKNKTQITIPDFTVTPVNLIDIIPNQLQKIEKLVLPEVKTPNTETPIQSDQLVNPVIVESSQADPDFTKNTENTNTTNTITEGTGTMGINPSSSAGTGTDNKTPSIQEIQLLPVLLWTNFQNFLVESINSILMWATILKNKI